MAPILMDFYHFHGGIRNSFSMVKKEAQVSKWLSCPDLLNLDFPTFNPMRSLFKKKKALIVINI